MNKPIISVIAPVYNTSQYLEQCIESVLNQSFTDWELILVDDGSTDSSLDIIRHYAESNDNVHYACSNAGCVSIARNTGLRMAKGEFVYFVDSDDYMSPDALLSLYRKTRSNPELDFVLGSFIVDNQTTGQLNKAARFKPMEKYNGVEMSGVEFLKTFSGEIMYPWGSLIKKKYLDDNKITFPEEISVQEDLVFVLAILLAGARCMYVDNSGIVYRWGRPSSLTTTTGIPVDKRKKNLKSIILSTVALQGLHHPDKNAQKFIDAQIVKNVTGVIGGASQLLPDKEVLDFLRANVKKVKVSGLGLRQFLATVYNISPSLALLIRRLLN